MNGKGSSSAVEARMQLPGRGIFEILCVDMGHSLPYEPHQLEVSQMEDIGI